MDYSIKILVVGNAGVGKTSLCNQYTDRLTFSQSYRPTVGVEFHSKTFYEINKDKLFISLWDISGQERYIGMTHVFYKNADFCLILFDLTNLESFEAAARWKLDLDSKYELGDGRRCPCLLIGNKCDLQSRVLSQTEIDDFCKKYGFFGYMEISVKNNVMVNETMNYIVEQAIKNKNKEDDDKPSLCIKLKEKLLCNNKTKCFSCFPKNSCC